MNSTIMQHAAPTVNSNRFVPAHPVIDARTQYMLDYDAGFALYQADKRLPHKCSDAMRDGWTDALNVGADSYWLGMMQEVN